MNKRGFSILEVLLSLAIICIAIVFLASSLPFGLLATQKVTTTAQANFLAQAKMEELASLTYQELEVIDTTEQSLTKIDTDFAGFSRETKTEYLDQDFNQVNEDDGLKKITVIVSWTDRIKKTVTQTELISLKTDY